jgi:hypothetical protein
MAFVNCTILAVLDFYQMNEKISNNTTPYTIKESPAPSPGIPRAGPSLGEEGAGDFSQFRKACKSIAKGIRTCMDFGGSQFQRKRECPSYMLSTI